MPENKKIFGIIRDTEYNRKIMEKQTNDEYASDEIINLIPEKTCPHCQDLQAQLAAKDQELAKISNDAKIRSHIIGELKKRIKTVCEIRDQIRTNWRNEAKQLKQEIARLQKLIQPRILSEEEREEKLSVLEEEDDE